MKNFDRRGFLRRTLASPLLSSANSMGHSATSSRKPTDICIESVSHHYDDLVLRTPLKFGGRVSTTMALLTVDCTVRTLDGRAARGFGAMPLGNSWSFPSTVVSSDGTMAAMKALADRLVKVTGDYRESGHPIDINCALEPAYLEAAAEVSKQLHLAEPIPKLCTLVTASPFDAAVHDAFGKVHNLNCYHTYGPKFMTYDLGHYNGPEFKGEQLDHYLFQEPVARMPVYHLVGALDPITHADVKKPINDGLPETLEEWIRYNGLTHLKIKLNGDDLNWDVERVVTVGRTIQDVNQKRGVDAWVISLDFNEKCKHVSYLMEFLHRVKEQSALTFDRIQYIEQPTARDLEKGPQNVMFEAAKIKPVVIDESLTGLDRLRMARDMGYTGVALKTCKGQSQSLLIAAAAEKYKMFICVQDLTCPGASLIQSAALAAHVPGVPAIEANARQFVPAANRAWEKKFPGIFHITDGTMNTGTLNGVGLGAGRVDLEETL
jgi:L-alanine-DL-glutamate epimerase-like enolase superfamily enzyme